jgi:hypothetical protein
LGDDLNNYSSPNRKGGSGGSNVFDRFSKTDTEAMAHLVKNHPINK